MGDRTTMYVIDKDYHILYRNPAFMEMYPGIECGQVCHRMLADSDEVCGHCPRLKGTARNTFYNVATNQWVKAQMAQMEWDGDPECYAVFCNVWDEDAKGEHEEIALGSEVQEKPEPYGTAGAAVSDEVHGSVGGSDLVLEGIQEREREVRELMDANLRMSSDMHRIQNELEDSNRELMKRNQMLSYISNEMPGGYHQCYADKGFTFRFISNQMLRILGFTHSEIVEQFDNQYAGLVHPDDIEQMKKGFYGRSDDGNAYEFRYRIMTKFGYIWVKDTTVRCEFDGEVFYQGTIVDITDEMNIQNKLMRRNNEMEVILASIPGGMKVSRLDDELTYQFVSDEAAALFGYTVDELLHLTGGKAANLAYEKDRTNAMEHALSLLESDGAYSVKYRVKCKNGRIKYIMDCGKKFTGEDGEVCVSSLYLDVTKERETEHLLELQRQLLDRELELKLQQEENIQKEVQQKLALEDALRQAEDANRAKTAFLNNMSHDIRTPMNAIVGFTKLATNHLDDRDKVEGYLGKITSSSNHLLSLINDVLDMSRIESGKMELDEEPENLSVMLQDMFDIIHTGMSDKGINFRVDVSGIRDSWVYCDKLRFNQVMLNILSNAVKFTDGGGEISVNAAQVFCGLEGHGAYEFHVSDTGIGMSRDFVKHIFEPFARERTSTVSGIQGTGLGMSITKNIVDMMGGSIRVASEEGKGTEFIVNLTFRLCDDAAHTADEETVCQAEGDSLDEQPEKNMLVGLAGDVGLMGESEPDDEFVGKTLLVVEDNELNREIAEEILNDYGFRVITAVDGTYGVDVVANSKPGDIFAVIMDIQMPVMNGYEATRRIRALPDRRLANIPIIAMTANAFEEDRKMAMEVKMDGYVPKPVHVPTLLETLKRVQR
jgi:PAS domain S-box-containing protein